MLIQGELTPLVLVSMDPRQLASDEQKERINSAANDDFNANRTDWIRDNIASIEKEYGMDNVNLFGKCKKCGGDRTTHYQKQMRSSDEPMTVFITCLTCGNRWRKG